MRFQVFDISDLQFLKIRRARFRDPQFRDPDYSNNENQIEKNQRKIILKTMFLGVVVDQNMVPKKDSSKTKHRNVFYFKLSIPYNYV